MRKPKFDVKDIWRESGETCLHVCAEYNASEMFQWFVENYKADVSALNKVGENPLIVAARDGKMDIVKLILDTYNTPEFKFEIDHKMFDGWTALSYAAINGFCHIIEILAKNGANINTTDRCRRSPFHWAARFNNLKVAKMLLELGAKYDEKDDEGFTP